MFRVRQRFPEGHLMQLGAVFLDSLLLCANHIFVTQFIGFTCINRRSELPFTCSVTGRLVWRNSLSGIASTIGS